MPVIAGTGSNNTHASIDLTKKATEVGVDAVMLVAPYYNKPSQEGMYQHFKAIAESTPLPVMLYNVRDDLLYKSPLIQLFVYQK